ELSYSDAILGATLYRYGILIPARTHRKDEIMHETTRPGPDSTTELRIIGQLEYLSPRSGLYDNGALPFRASSPEAGPIAQLAASRVDGDQVADVLDQIASYAAFLTSGDTHPVAALYLATVLVEQGDVSSGHVSDAARMAGDIHD